MREDPLGLLCKAAAARFGDDSVATANLLHLAAAQGLDLDRDEAWAMIRAARDGTRPEVEGPAAETNGGPRLVALEDVEPSSIEWLWPGRLAVGKYGVTAGDPGLGKSTLWMDVAARLSRGQRLPDGHVPDGPVDVLFVSDEDGIADTVRPRVEAAGADLSRVHTVVDGTLNITGDIACLAGFIQQADARLVVLDPMSAFFPAEVNTWRDADVRAALRPLVKLLEATSCALEGVAHLNKDSKKAAIHRVSGSMAIVAAARVALAVGRDPDDETQVVLAHLKNNLSRPARSLALRIEATPDDVAVVRWLGESKASAATIWHALNPEDRSAVDQAVDFLAEVLADGSVENTRVRRMARDEGISDTTLKRAKAQLGVESVKHGFASAGGWRWCLPEDRSDAAAEQLADLAGEEVAP